jgi:UTP--glucose-1-phosphate uridylyltransferase
LKLETAAGAAIRHFRNVRGINVPRSRFLPVKSCSDLLLIKSDVYTIKHGQPVISEDRMFETTPVIKLDEHFKKVILCAFPTSTLLIVMGMHKIQDFHKRFKTIPEIVDLDHLTVSGDVHFGRNVTLRGTVISTLHKRICS